VVNNSLDEILSVRSLGYSTRLKNKSYVIPKTNQNSKIKHGMMTQEKRGDYITVTTESKTDLIKVFLNKRPSTPSSAKYSHISNWAKTIGNRTIPKAEKITLIAKIFRDQKKNKSPAPNSYKPIIKSVKD
jgi:hypothetical protein